MTSNALSNYSGRDRKATIAAMVQRSNMNHRVATLENTRATAVSIRRRRGVSK